MPYPTRRWDYAYFEEDSPWPLPASGLMAADAPDFERYDADFAPRTGMGGVEIWVPLAP